MKENKNKSYVLHIDSVESYINSVESFKNYKIPNVNLIKTESLTEKQMADIFTNNWISIKKRYNKKLWKMLKEIYAKQLKIDSIWIDSSIANLSFELFDKKQNLHTFKVHTKDSVLDFKEFKKQRTMIKENATPFFFVDSFTGPCSYSGRGIMRSAQFENIFNAAREFGNRYAEANGDCSELLNPEVGKKDSDNGCLKDRPGRVKYVEEDANKEPIVDVNYDKSETGDNGFSWNISVKVPDCINHEDDWNIYQNVAGEFVVRNCYKHKNLASAIEFISPVSVSVNSVIVITEEVNTDMIGAVVYTKGMKIASPWVRVDSISDVVKLMTIPLYQHMVVAKKSVWKKLKNNVSEKEQSGMQGKTEEIEKTNDADNEEIIIIYRQDGVDTASKKNAKICSYRRCKVEDVRTILRKYHEGDVFNIIEKNSELHNFLLEKLESPSMELTGPSSSKNFIIYIQGELLYNTGSLSEKEKLSCKYTMHANTVDLVYLYFPIPEQFISGKIKVLTQQQDARQIHMPIKIDKGECTFKFNVGGFTEKDCSLDELADKLNDSKLKCGDNISAEIKIAHNQLEMNLINKIAEILNSDCSVSSSLVANDKVAMILHEVEHYKFQKDFEGDEINGLSINPRNPEITKSTFNRRKKCENKANEIIVGNTYILNGNNNLEELEGIGLYVGQPVLVLQKEPSGLCLIQSCNSQKFGSIPSDNLSPFCKQDNKKPLESMIGGKYILNGSNDIGIDCEIRPYIGKKVVVTKLHKNGLFSIMCNKEGEEKVFNGIAKYNLTPIFKDSIDNENKSDFNVSVSECNNPGPILTKFMDDLAKEKTIVSESKEEIDDAVSEYLDNTEYDAIIEYITNKASKEDMSTVVSKKDSSFFTYLPKDFRERVFDLSFLIDINNKLETSPFIGIIQQELSLSRSDKEMIGDLDTLTFEQLVELFTVLASMKGMIKILNKDTNEWKLVPQEEKLSLCSEICNVVNSDANSMLKESSFDDAINKTEVETQKPKLTYNGIHLADIESIKIEKFAILLIMPTAKTGTFGKDSRKVVYELYDNIDLALETINQTLYSIGKYSLLKYNSIASNLFSSILPEKFEASFSVFNGRLIKVLIDIDAWFYIQKLTLTGLELECKNIEHLQQHNAKITNKDLHSAIKILDNEVEKKYTFSQKSLCDKILDNIEKEEEIKTSYTMAAIKDGQYLFLDDSVFKIGEDRSEAFNSMLRAEGHKEEVFYTLYSFEDKVRCNYYIDAANAKDKIISAVYVSSSYSGYNKNIAPREHQKADIEDIKTEKENNIKLAEDEMVFIIAPRENDIFDIVYKSKSELETNEEFVNYRTKFINPSSNLFVLIKNHLLYMAESDNYSLTKEQISSVNKIYVPSHAIGLHYITTPAAGVCSLDIIFSYSLQECDSIDKLELKKGGNARKAFYDFKEEEKLN